MSIPQKHIQSAQEQVVAEYRRNFPDFEKLQHIEFAAGYLCLGQLSYVFKVKLLNEEQDHFALVTGFTSFDPRQSCRVFADMGIYDETAARNFIKYMGRRIKNSGAHTADLSGIDPDYIFDNHDLDYQELDPFRTTFFAQCMSSVDHSRSLVGFMLLNKAVLDRDSVIKAVKEMWGLDFNEHADAVIESDETSVSISFAHVTARVTLSDEPMEKDLALQAARLNYMWPMGASVISEHQAVLCITMTSSELKKHEMAAAFVMLMAALASLPETLGVFYRGFIFEPQFYIERAEIIHDNHFPVGNLIWKHLEQGEGNSINAYTVGLEVLDRLELEIHNCNMEVHQLLDMIDILTMNIIECNLNIPDGEILPLTDHSDIRFTISIDRFGEHNSYKLEIIDRKH